ncbi:MAG: hypothetical protein ACOWWO_01845 [Peptococcaceae bacterium]
MKKINKLACTVIFLVFFLSNTIFAQGNAKEILTLEEVQDLAIQNSRTKTNLHLTESIIDNNMSIVKDSIKRIEANYTSLYLKVRDLNDITEDERYQDLLEKQESGQTLTEEESKEWMEYQALLAVSGKTSGDMNSSLGSLSGNKGSLKDQERELEYSQEDLEKAQKDYEEETKEIAALMMFESLKIKDSINVLEKIQELKIKLRDIEKVKADLGISLENDVTRRRFEAGDNAKQLENLQATYQVFLGNINDLIGRELESPLTPVKYNVPEVINAVPQYAALKKEILNHSYKLYTLNRELEDLEKDLDETNGSNSAMMNRNTIEMKKSNLESEQISLENELHNKLAAYEQAGTTYQEEIINCRNAEKTYSWDQQKYELGMISATELISSEINYLQSINKKVAAAYDYYLIEKELDAMKNGINLENYYLLKNSMLLQS